LKEPKVSLLNAKGEILVADKEFSIRPASSKQDHPGNPDEVGFSVYQSWENSRNEAIYGLGCVVVAVHEKVAH
jgi:hypothetical protein